MKKIILTFLIVVIGLVGYSQTRTQTAVSPDGKLKAVCYTEGTYYDGGQIPYTIWQSTQIELFEMVEGGWGKILYIYEKMDSYKGERFPVERIAFNQDGSKLYFSSRLVAYEYDIKDDKYTKLFQDFDGRVAISDISGDTLFVRGITNINYFNNKFWKYIDGNYIPYTPVAYVDIINGGTYLNGKKCVTRSEEYYEAMEMLGYKIKRR